MNFEEIRQAEIQRMGQQQDAELLRADSSGDEENQPIRNNNRNFGRVNRLRTFRTLIEVNNRLRELFEARGQRLAMHYRADTRRLSQSAIIAREAENHRPINHFVWNAASETEEIQRHTQFLLEMSARISRRLADEMIPVVDDGNHH